MHQLDRSTLSVISRDAPWFTIRGERVIQGDMIFGHAYKYCFYSVLGLASSDRGTQAVWWRHIADTGVLKKVLYATTES